MGTPRPPRLRRCSSKRRDWRVRRAWQLLRCGRRLHSGPWHEPSAGKRGHRRVRRARQFLKRLMSCGRCRHLRGCYIPRRWRARIPRPLRCCWAGRESWQRTCRAGSRLLCCLARSTRPRCGCALRWRCWRGCVGVLIASDATRLRGSAFSCAGLARLWLMPGVKRQGR